MLAFDTQGSGATTVALLHGVGGGRSIWADGNSGTVAAIAGAGYRVFAFDFPGYGDSPRSAVSSAPGPAEAGRPSRGSSKLAESHSLESTTSMAAAVARALRAQGIERAVLIGHSMGGMVAQELAALQPGFVQGLVLACTSPAFGKPGGDWQQRFLRDRLAPLDAGEGMPALAQRMVRTMVAPGASEQAMERAAAVMARVPEATYRAALAAIVGFDRRGALAAIAVPTLCLAAQHDRTAPPEVVQRMAQQIAGAEYRCIAGAGHIANVERPQAFNTAVVEFLNLHFDKPKR